jgi:uncharacterized membrane protein
MVAPASGSRKSTGAPRPPKIRPVPIAVATLVGTMIGTLAKRVVEVAVLALATYAFFRVPIGRRTTYQHLAAIFSTEPAREAADDYRHAAAELKDDLVARAKGMPTSPSKSR